MRVITVVEIDPEAMTLTFLTLPDDIRENGLTQQHRLTVPRSTDYIDGIEAVVEALTDLLDDALEDFPKVPAYVPKDRDEEDDDDL